MIQETGHLNFGHVFHERLRRACENEEGGRGNGAQIGGELKVPQMDG